MSMISSLFGSRLSRFIPGSHKINASLSQLDRISADIMDSNMSMATIALQRQAEAAKS